jgi:predicted outer membrane repeat protein
MVLGATLSLAVAWCGTAAAQTTTTSTTAPTTTPTSVPPTTTAPTTPTTAPPRTPGVIAQAGSCVAVDATSYAAAFTTASGTTPNACTDGAGNEVIVLAAPSGEIDLTGTQGVYSGTAPLILDGNGQTVNAGGSTRAFTSSATLTTINDVTLEDGFDIGSRGGLVRTKGPLVVNGSTFENSLSFDGGGAIDVESGNVTVTDSTFEGNLALFGGVHGVAAQGGAIDSHRSGSASSPVPVVTIVGSTFLGNQTAFNDGGAVYSDGNVVVVNSTISQNSVGPGGHGGGITAANITLAYSTVTDNLAAIPVLGNDLALRFLHGTPNLPGTLQTFGSVITSITSADCAYEFIPTGTSSGYNYLSDSSCYPGFNANPAPTDVVTTTDPQLGPPASNGGPTLTQLPASTSPLVDAIPLAACQTPPLATGITTDQRGLSRPSGPGCDIGAVELQVASVFTAPTARFTG